MDIRVSRPGGDYEEGAAEWRLDAKKGLVLEAKAKHCRSFNEWDENFTLLACKAPEDARDLLLQFRKWMRLMSFDYAWDHLRKFYDHLCVRMEKEASTTFELVSYTAHWEMYKRDKGIKEKCYGGGGGGSGSSWNAVGTGSRYSKKPRVSDPEQPDASVVKPDKPEGEIVVEPEEEREDGVMMASGDREPEPAEALKDWPDVAFLVREELLEELAVAVERYQDGAYAESTQRSYDTGVKAFLTFCGVRRQWDRPAKPVMPIMLRDLARMAEFADMESITGLALWAAILVGFYGLFRKDNLTAGKSQAWNARALVAGLKSLAVQVGLDPARVSDERTIPMGNL
ncbi:hypothetical protein CYMTET_54754 [Cymbomonas tetramitiformis]|uniref:Core-binding (CB) domain-containing protein n=1 Tax=Cymbomonas tetramitiformis TaxID=36881 RepID=A0AAE0BEA4_9CHLO|nr:hypothetical protein CYMTET_54754 [Cymbomonas tetramitiformis]